MCKNEQSENRSRVINKKFGAGAMLMKTKSSGHRRSQGGQKGHGPPKFLENIVIFTLRGVFPTKIVLFA